ncbi:MAG: SCP2 sterol-binding domain-containing protein [Clostridiales bacterium]|jgi:putative sterol carrier protein/multimeric flavodoxin WrbA|nr:SCP2 sterol-binding domain-containing protein [Clostridiales bacterium]
MKIAAVTAPLGADFGLNAAFKIACDTLTETGEEVQVFNLASLDLGFYDEERALRANGIMEGIRAADGVIFAFSVSFGAPNALIWSFLDYFADNSYKSYLGGKPCLILAISQDGGERPALETMANAILNLGGFDTVRVGLNNAAASVVKKEVIELVERQTEDFYRIMRQNRKYILPTPPQAAPGEAADPLPRRVLPIDIEQIHQKHDLDNITQSQQEDINKIAAIFAKKFVSDDNGVLEYSPVAISAPKQPVGRSVKQLTAALPHHFNPHLAKDVNATIQLNITGLGGFNAYLTISPTECDFKDGEAENNDIIVTADSRAWNDVLSKKVTAQKAFMMGQLKVRGNFVLLTKFDQMFSTIS